MGPAPVKGNGRLGHTPVGSNFAQGGQQGLATVPKPPIKQAPGPWGPGRGIPGGLGQEPKGKGAVGDQFDPQLLAEVGKPPRLGRLGSQQGQLDLEAAQSHTTLLKMAMDLAQAGGSQVGNTNGSHLSRQLPIHQPVQQGPLLPGGITGRAPVQLHQIEVALEAVV